MLNTETEKKKINSIKIKRDSKANSKARKMSLSPWFHKGINHVSSVLKVF